LFVTWHLENGSSDEDIELRGCIGTLSPTKLLNLKDYTIKSALKDRRFHPIGPDEFHKLHCSVSLLVDYEQAEHYEDWEVRLHLMSTLIEL
jgi:AMMECR1 domain-containing protein